MGSRIGGLRCAAGRIGVPLEEYQRRQAAGQKWCHACQGWHPVGAFSFDSSRADGRNSICKDAQRLDWRRRQDGRQNTHRMD